MNSAEEVPFKIPLGVLGEVTEEVGLITMPDITVPDYLNILQETEYEFSLENGVLMGLQGGYPTQPQVPCCPSDVLPSCPPYWMMFSSPQESRLASRWSSDLWEPNPRRRSRSLNASQFRSIDGRVHFTISDSEDEDAHGDEGSTSRSQGGDFKNGAGSSRQFLDLPGSRLVPAQPVPSEQKNRSINVRQTSLTTRNPPRAPPQRSLSMYGHSPLPSNQTSVTVPKKSQANISPLPRIRFCKPSLLFLASYPRPPPRCSDPRPLGSQAVMDSSAELLSALSEEERNLVEAITDRGYTLRTAIIALQKTREHSSEQILNYLVACDRLCELGFEAAEVEEALEMFQNCETKAEEFLHLLAQFNEMGFQQHAIKEVLLVHENHRERALEELMARVA